MGRWPGVGSLSRAQRKWRRSSILGKMVSALAFLLLLAVHFAVAALLGAGALGALLASRGAGPCGGAARAWAGNTLGIDLSSFAPHAGAGEGQTASHQKSTESGRCCRAGPDAPIPGAVKAIN